MGSKVSAIQQDPVDEAVKKIIGAIETGKIKPGDRITESFFSQELGLSRVPVREALRILAGDGVVELVKNRGARLRIIPPKEIFEMLKVQDALVRFAIEELLKKEENTININKIRGQSEKITQAYEARSIKHILREMVKFHELIIAGADNTYLNMITTKHYLGLYELHIKDMVDLDVLEGSHSYYQKVAQAIEIGSVEGACHFMKVKNQEVLQKIAAKLNLV